MAKFGFRADDVKKMSHLEVNAWIDSYLASQGVKPSVEDKNTTTYVFARRKKSGT
ncbi:hypothetical protein [Caviibacterium pharyngocola]|uniref:hypothetical protein n=1 Tax=Caviibacterium pharyngocola TaxID=28159 RepID=UPI0013FD5A35|nr:hypothetical protein [Caviibacterium pharyngocola]